MWYEIRHLISCFMAHRCTLVPDVKVSGQTKILTFSHAEDTQEGQKLSWYGRLAAVQGKDAGPNEQKNRRGFKAGCYSYWLHPHLSQIKPQLTPAERAGANGSLLPAWDQALLPVAWQLIDLKRWEATELDAFLKTRSIIYNLPFNYWSISMATSCLTYSGMKKSISTLTSIKR